MKTKIRNLKDIQREKQKFHRKIGIQKYAIEFNLIQIRKKLSFVSLSAYLVDIASEQLKAKAPSFLTGLLNVFLERISRKK
ncbi:MAG: hypothetical protein ACOYMF_14055 [Bacteroidales bacterium]